MRHHETHGERSRGLLSPQPSWTGPLHLGVALVLPLHGAMTRVAAVADHAPGAGAYKCGTRWAPWSTGSRGSGKRIPQRGEEPLGVIRRFLRPSDETFV